jgi:hypothetical protein
MGSRAAGGSIAAASTATGDLELNLSDAFLHRNYTYKDCPIVKPKSWGGDSLRSITAPFKPRALLKAKKPVTISNKGRDGARGRRPRLVRGLARSAPARVGPPTP